jgi:hypothetical protein
MDCVDLSTLWIFSQRRLQFDSLLKTTRPQVVALQQHHIACLISFKRAASGSSL